MRDVGGVDTALLREMVINLHFALLRVRKLVLDQFPTLLISSCSVTKSSGELMVRYSRTSSAYSYFSPLAQVDLREIIDVD